MSSENDINISKRRVPTRLTTIPDSTSPSQHEALSTSTGEPSTEIQSSQSSSSSTDVHTQPNGDPVISSSNVTSSSSSDAIPSGTANQDTPSSITSSASVFKTPSSASTNTTSTNANASSTIDRLAYTVSTANTATLIGHPGPTLNSTAHTHAQSPKSKTWVIAPALLLPVFFICLIFLILRNKRRNGMRNRGLQMIKRQIRDRRKPKPVGIEFQKRWVKEGVVVNVDVHVDSQDEL